MFATPLGLLALAAVPVVVALHLFRRRFEPRAVAALFLWRTEDAVPLAGRKREPLRTNASFWCEVAAALFLALAIAGPRAGCIATRGEHLVVVLDSSASLGAVTDGESARDRAAALVAARIAGLPRGSRVTLVASGPRPRLLAGPAAFPAEAEERLGAWQPLATTHDLVDSVALAAQFAGTGSVLLVTDHYRPEVWPQELELVSVGRPVDNWGITHGARAREPDADGRERERVFVTVTSFASVARGQAVRLTAGDATLAEQRVSLAPGASTQLAFDVPPDTGRVEVRLEPDALALDGVLRLVPPPLRTLALASTLELSELQALGLAAGDEGIRRWLDLVPHAVAAPSAAAAHLVLGRAEADGPLAWSLVLPALAEPRRDLIGPFLADRANRLLEGTTFEGSVWSIDPELVLPGVALVSAGNLPILTEQRRGTRRSWFLNFDAQRSSLVRSPDWPILLLNLAEARRATLPGPERTNLVLGEPFRYRPGSELAGIDRAAPILYTLEGPLDEPGAQPASVQALEEVVVDDLARPGAYRLAFGGRALAEFALNFTDARESDLRAARPGQRPAAQGATPLEDELSWIELALLVGTLGLVLADAWVLARAAQGSAG